MGGRGPARPMSRSRIDHPSPRRQQPVPGPDRFGPCQVDFPPGGESLQSLEEQYAWRGESGAGRSGSRLHLTFLDYLDWFSKFLLFTTTRCPHLPSCYLGYCNALHRTQSLQLLSHIHSQPLSPTKPQHCQEGWIQRNIQLSAMSN